MPNHLSFYLPTHPSKAEDLTAEDCEAARAVLPSRTRRAQLPRAAQYLYDWRAARPPRATPPPCVPRATLRHAVAHIRMQGLARPHPHTTRRGRTQHTHSVSPLDMGGSAPRPY